MLLSERYQEFFATYDDTPLLAIDTSSLNVPESDEVVDEIYEKIVSLAARKTNVSEKVG